MPDPVAEKAPKETRMIYAYRAYHAERREGFPLFDMWGEPWPKRGRRSSGSARPAPPGRSARYPEGRPRRRSNRPRRFSPPPLR